MTQGGFIFPTAQACCIRHYGKRIIKGATYDILHAKYYFTYLLRGNGEYKTVYSHCTIRIQVIFTMTFIQHCILESFKTEKYYFSANSWQFLDILFFYTYNTMLDSSELFLDCVYNLFMNIIKYKIFRNILY